MIRVTPRSRSRRDAAGDPLDGLVNLFDLGIVLSVGFLLAALSSLDLTGALAGGVDAPARPGQGAPVTVPPGGVGGDVPPAGSQVVGTGERVGTVYRLADGRLVYVVPKASTSPGTSPGTSPSPAP